MFGSGGFWDKSLSWFLKILKLFSFYSGNFQIFKYAPGQLIPNQPPKHVIASTNYLIMIDPIYMFSSNYISVMGYLKQLSISVWSLNVIM